VAAAIALVSGCRTQAPADRVQATGYVEANDVRVAAEVGGRLVELAVSEGDRVRAGDLVARLDTTATELALARAGAERRAANAQLRLLEAGSRPEDIRQASAQAEAARADVMAARAELTSAEQDLDRFEALLKSNSGSRKQRDDAATRRDVARERVRAAEDRSRAAAEARAKIEAGARPQEIEAARARVAATDAEIARLAKARADATVVAPLAGLVTGTFVDQGELIAPGVPMVLIVDLDRAWVNAFIGEPDLSRIGLGQPATVRTDGGDTLEGTVTFVSDRAEFTPRNVQTADERSKLVYRIKITVDNRAGVLKQGMPVEAELARRPIVEKSKS
jgi:HlyD family secretion protein